MDEHQPSAPLRRLNASNTTVIRWPYSRDSIFNRQALPAVAEVHGKQGVERTVTHISGVQITFEGSEDTRISGVNLTTVVPFRNYEFLQLMQFVYMDKITMVFVENVSNMSEIVTPMELVTTTTTTTTAVNITNETVITTVTTTTYPTIPPHIIDAIVEPTPTPFVALTTSLKPSDATQSPDSVTTKDWEQDMSDSKNDPTAEQGLEAWRDPARPAEAEFNDTRQVPMQHPSLYVDFIEGAVEDRLDLLNAMLNEEAQNPAQSRAQQTGELVASSAVLADEWVAEEIGVGNLTAFFSEYKKAATLIKVEDNDFRSMDGVLGALIPLGMNDAQYPRINALMVRDTLPILDVLEDDVLPEIDPLRLKDWPNFIRTALLNVSELIDPSIEFWNLSDAIPTPSVSTTTTTTAFVNFTCTEANETCLPADDCLFDMLSELVCIMWSTPLHRWVLATGCRISPELTTRQFIQDGTDVVNQLDEVSCECTGGIIHTALAIASKLPPLVPPPPPIVVTTTEYYVLWITKLNIYNVRGFWLCLLLFVSCVIQATMVGIAEGRERRRGRKILEKERNDQRVARWVAELEERERLRKKQVLAQIRETAARLQFELPTLALGDTPSISPASTKFGQSFSPLVANDQSNELIRAVQAFGDAPPAPPRAERSPPPPALPPPAAPPIADLPLAPLDFGSINIQEVLAAPSILLHKGVRRSRVSLMKGFQAARKRARPICVWHHCLLHHKFLFLFKPNNLYAFTGVSKTGIFYLSLLCHVFFLSLVFHPDLSLIGGTKNCDCKTEFVSLPCCKMDPQRGDTVEVFPIFEVLGVSCAAAVLSNLFLVALRGPSFREQCKHITDAREREDKYVAAFLSAISPMDARLTLSGAVTIGFTFGAVWLVGFVLFSFTSSSVMYETAYSDRPGFVEKSVAAEEQPERDAANSGSFDFNWIFVPQMKLFCCIGIISVFFQIIIWDPLVMALHLFFDTPSFEDVKEGLRSIYRCMLGYLRAVFSLLGKICRWCCRSLSKCQFSKTQKPSQNTGEGQDVPAIEDEPRQTSEGSSRLGLKDRLKQQFKRRKNNDGTEVIEVSPAQSRDKVLPPPPGGAPQTNPPSEPGKISRLLGRFKRKPPAAQDNQEPPSPQ
eukprot:gnl/MRDRNA2_/MRDRNA2_143835_c0_seq1.p1 gnl/MRDRNA2_/MRDRNA2_143835_c0~~gnl/MRDRNA2_/MRDRNA2_143835_c0_seq1.p1  ORF type:complete len:1252 (+),score=183.62 gnl/MRDRNA2_/MRDRNA2_143835_c0_seq1:376-3756(+)